MMLWSYIPKNYRLISRWIYFPCIIRPTWSRYFNVTDTFCQFCGICGRPYQWPWISLRGHL